MVADIKSLELADLAQSLKGLVGVDIPSENPAEYASPFGLSYHVDIKQDDRGYTPPPHTYEEYSE